MELDPTVSPTSAPMSAEGVRLVNFRAPPRYEVEATLSAPAPWASSTPARSSVAMARLMWSPLWLP